MMANYYETARTNYFAVKDEKKFLEEINNVAGINVVSTEDKRTGNLLFAVLGDMEDGFPDCFFDEEIENFEKNYLFEGGIIERHLADGWVCVRIGIGNEKLRYLSGYAIAFNNRGEVKEIFLDDIYEIASALGNRITKAEY
jgi:hypothetical protein